MPAKLKNELFCYRQFAKIWGNNFIFFRIWLFAMRTKLYQKVQLGM